MPYPAKLVTRCPTLYAMSKSAREVGNKAQNSRALDVAVRGGLIAYGVVHILIAWLAISLALGDKKGSASSDGALSELASKPFGSVLLYLVAAGFAALVVWQLIETVAGNQDKDGIQRKLRQGVAAGKAIIFGALCASAIKVAVGSGSSSEGKTNSFTARIMDLPAGQVVVALVGLIIIGVGCALIYRGLTESFIDNLTSSGKRGKSGTSYVLAGKVGYVSKGVAMFVVGGLFVWAAITHDSEKSGGLDQALHTVLEQPFGSLLLIMVGAGIGCFGVFCFAQARHLDQ